MVAAHRTFLLAIKGCALHQLGARKHFWWNTGQKTLLVAHGFINGLPVSTAIVLKLLTTGIVAHRPRFAERTALKLCLLPVKAIEQSVSSEFGVREVLDIVHIELNCRVDFLHNVCHWSCQMHDQIPRLVQAQRAPDKVRCK